MRLKTYFASGVDAAINLARTELGPEAMLVHSKRTVGESASLGAYEVVFALSEQNETAQRTSHKQKNATQQLSESHDGKLDNDIAGLREAVEMTLRLARRSEALLSAQYRSGGEFADLASSLEDAGFTSQFRIRLLQELRDTTGTSIRRRAISWMQRQVRVDHQFGRAATSRRAVVLIGPPGAGKSITLSKIAARFGITGRRPAQILSLDTERIGATEMVKAYAGVLGIGFQALDSPYGLGQALAEHSNKELVLIDTPGLTVRGATEEKELASFLTERADLDKHLVLPATASAATLKSYIEAFAPFAPGKLLFTRLDEVTAYMGPLVEMAIDSGLPLSLIGTGQRTPEDLEMADPASYCEQVIPPWMQPETILEQSKQAAA